MTTAALLANPTLTSESAIEAACHRIPPLWALDSFVAVNPFVGLSDVSFEDAARLIEAVTHAPICAEYRATESILTVADWLDCNHGTNWSAFVTDEISKWCASYFDLGQSIWPMPWRQLSLYEAWKEAASIDATPEISGLRGFRQLVRDLPASPSGTIELALARFSIDDGDQVDFLHRELVTVFGWAAYCVNKSFVADLLAIRLAYDSALLAKSNGFSYKVAAPDVPGMSIEDAELQYRAGLLERIASNQRTSRCSRPRLQAVFCIDVRSERYRRALESQSPAIETIGFAGFFGLAVEYASSARCPVLLSPKYRLSAPSQQVNELRAGWQTLQTSASACFNAVEVGGLFSAVSMLVRSIARRPGPVAAPEFTFDIPAEERVHLAGGALANMSLDPTRLAPTVLICGHGSTSANNPYAASLDCGACGGHKGDVNARLAATLLNDPLVRSRLGIPEDTVFVSGLHDTTTQTVTVFDSNFLSDFQKAELGRLLRAASQEAGADRAAQRRSADWSETRPEWGLAGNAAFIAAPRSFTRGLDLEGRVFLHDYDPDLDHDGSVLTLILTAPVIVASWINLQYFGSVMNNSLFGSGNKVLHNVVGKLGVWEGNGGDLRTGLPMQSLHDGSKWMHEPLRLRVLVNAPQPRIDRVLRENASIRELVENEWIFLEAI
jgi:uncharacterized protein YbcC (UPF0753/DUF2309 family)